jgi:hypothetical protein
LRFQRFHNYAVTFERYQEFISKKIGKDGFIIDVLKDKKIMLVGDERELKKA